jgi:carbon monoxide dehydrogenase subunit G
MHLSGTVDIAATRSAVWDLLMDVERLAGCGPDVDSIERRDATHATVRATVGVGFMRAGVTLDLELTDVVPPEQISLKGVGEASGNRLEASGHVTLSGPPQGPTSIEWTADLEVSGPLAGMAGRMIEGAASRIIDETFDCIRSALGAA